MIETQKNMESNSQIEQKYSPLVNELAGIISLPEDYDYKADYIKHLEEKYELPSNATQP